MKKVLRLTCALILLMGVYGIAGAATVTFSPNPVPDQILGSAFSVSIIGQDFPATVGGDVLVEWDPSILTLTLPDVTQTWTGDTWGAESTASVAAGSLNISSGAFGVPVSSVNFGIADLLFTASGLGTSPLDLSVSFWADENFTAFAPQPSAVSGSVSVVPIPGSILLLGSGLIGLIGMARRKKS